MVTFALVWGLLLIFLSLVLPVVTVLSGRDGPQPRVTLVQEYGPVAVLPAVAALVAVAAVAWLIAFGNDAPALGPLTLARAIAALVCIAALVATVTLHIVGALVLPLAFALLVATLTVHARAE
jgi:hypothetical protein